MTRYIAFHLGLRRLSGYGSRRLVFGTTLISRNSVKEGNERRETLAARIRYIRFDRVTGR